MKKKLILISILLGLDIILNYIVEKDKESVKRKEILCKKTKEIIETDKEEKFDREINL